VQVDKTASGGNLTADVEGMSIYYNSDGTGYLLVSSQGTSTVAVYTRDSSKTSINTYLGAFKVVANGAIDATTGSDGLDVTNFPLGSPFPQGLFVIHDASNSGGAASNHKLVLWENVAAALNLLIDTIWDPRQVGL
ncbi:MAG: phytase, partial [bacterium]|nr:phytase [bacterium]